MEDTYDLNYPDGFVRQINSLDETLKKYNEKIKELKKKREFAHAKLSEWMNKKRLDTYKGISAKKPPAPRKKPVTKKYKNQHTRKLLQDIGVPDPDDILERLNKINEGKS